MLSVCSETQSLIKTTSVRKVVGNKQKRGGGGMMRKRWDDLPALV